MAGTTIARTAPPPAPEASEPLTTTPPTTVVPTTPPPATQVETIVTCGEVFLTTLEDGEKAPFTESVAGEPDAQLLAFAAAGPPADAEESTESRDAPDDSVTVAASSGTSAGVFAGQRGIPARDTDLLVAQLAADPATASAWAGVQDIEENEIPSFVSTLTATVLARDLRVTDHSFVDGRAVPRQAVLQIGTAAETAPTPPPSS